MQRIYPITLQLKNTRTIERILTHLQNFLHTGRKLGSPSDKEHRQTHWSSNKTSLLSSQRGKGPLQDTLNGHDNFSNCVWSFILQEADFFDVLTDDFSFIGLMRPWKRLLASPTLPCTMLLLMYIRSPLRVNGKGSITYRYTHYVT